MQVKANYFANSFVKSVGNHDFETMTTILRYEKHSSS